MVTISLCMIVKNEEAVLARCLDSAKECVDEIIIADTGSTDKTKEIARKYTDRIYDFEWVNDFSAARNFAFSKAAMDYQMWLDADDELDKAAQAGIIQLKQSMSPAVDMVTMKYNTHFDAGGNPILTSTRERLVKREKNYRWIDPVHECIPMAGNILHSDIAIHHRKVSAGNPTRNIDIYSALESSGKPLTPRQMYYFARELKDHGHWAKSAYYFNKFLNSGMGWHEDNIAACLGLSNCYTQLKDEHKILPVLLKSFEYDIPRADICTELGYYYKNMRNFQQAFKWFDLAAKLGRPDSFGFIRQDYYGYIPNIECCVCLCEMGDFQKASIYNERAAQFKLTPAIEINRKFLAAKL